MTVTLTRNSLLLACLLGVAGLASAQTPAPTRAEVKSEAAAANKDGTLSKGTIGAPSTENKPGTVTGDTNSRAAVKQEARAANKDGTISKGTVGTGPSKKRVKKKTSEKNRADVKAETRAANKDGTIPKGEGSPGDVKK